jgi:hypothetical protein
MSESSVELDDNKDDEVSVSLSRDHLVKANFKRNHRERLKSKDQLEE